MSKSNIWPDDVMITFGKYRGQTLGDILSGDPKYLDWIGDAHISNPSLAQAITAMRDKYSAEIDRATGSED